MALITLIDEARQWFKARVGFEARETTIARSLCIHAAAEPGLTVIPDLSLDERTKANPSVDEDHGLRFYAGAPLLTSDGQAIGTLCVLDHEPRPAGLEPHQASTIAVLARQAMAQIELRRAVSELALKTETLRAQEGRLRTDFETIYQFQGLLARVGRLIDANAVSLKAIDRTLADVVGHSYWDTPWFAETPGLRERVRIWVDQVAVGQTVREEVHVLLLGHPRIFDFAMRPVRASDGKVVGMVPEAVDVTERRASEAQLRQSQKMEAVGQLTGGHVKIYSEPGHGTTLKVYLPRYVGPDAAVAEVAAAPARGGSLTETILVVEDDERMRACSVESLRELGYEVTHVGGAAEALALAEAGRSFTLLFTDVVMPGLTGQELAGRMLAKQPGLRVLYTTGYTRNAVLHNGVLDAGTHLLPKPFGIAQPAEKVRAVLDG